MASEMVERVARAIALTYPSNEGNDEYWQEYISEARAAIQAMREPSRQMIDKVSPTRLACNLTEDDLRFLLEQIVDAALEDAG